MDWTRTISPSLVNEVRFWRELRLQFKRRRRRRCQRFGQTVGIPGVPSAFLPAMNFQGAMRPPSATVTFIKLFADTVIHYEDTIIWTKGSHTMHIGFQGYRYRNGYLLLRQ